MTVTDLPADLGALAAGDPITPAALARRFRTDGRPAHLRTPETVWHLLARRAAVTATDRDMLVVDIGDGHHALYPTVGSLDIADGYVAHGTRYAMRVYPYGTVEGLALLDLLHSHGPRHLAAPHYPHGLVPALVVRGYRTGPTPADRPDAVDLAARGVDPDKMRDLLDRTDRTGDRQVVAWTIHPDRDWPHGLIVAHTGQNDRVVFNAAVLAGVADLPGVCRVYGTNRPLHVVDADGRTTGVVMPVRHPAACWAD